MSKIIKVDVSASFIVELSQWLMLCAESKYSVPFENHSPEEKQEIIDDFSKTAIDLFELQRDDKPQYLRLKDGYRTRKYFEFLLEERHYVVNIHNPFTAKTFTIPLPLLHEPLANLATVSQQK